MVPILLILVNYIIIIIFILHHHQSPADPKFLKSSKIKTKVSDNNNKIPATTMSDTMASVHQEKIKLQENNKILVKQQLMYQKEIDRAAKMNTKLHLNTSKTNKDQPPPSTIHKTKKNLTINSVCSSVEELDDDSSIMKLANDSKKRKQPSSSVQQKNDSKKTKEQNYKTKQNDNKDNSGKTDVSDKTVANRKAQQAKKNNKKAPVKSKFKKLNLDEELDEKHKIWEVARDWNAKYTRRNTVMDKNFKRKNLIVEGLENYRKEVEKEGELLIRWKDGRRDWTYCIDAKKDASAAMYNAAMKKFGYTDNEFCYGLSRKEENEEKARKKLLRKQKMDAKYAVENQKEGNCIFNLSYITI